MGGDQAVEGSVDIPFPRCRRQQPRQLRRGHGTSADHIAVGQDGLHLQDVLDGPPIHDRVGPGRVVPHHAPPRETEIFADGLGVATGIAFGPGGTLFVGDRTGGIFAVEPQGSVRRFARLSASVAAYHLAFGPDGNLYVTAPTMSNDDPIFRISPAGMVSRCFEHLARPMGLAFDRDGNLFVVAIHKGERGIFRLGKDGQATLAVAGENLVGLAFDERGRMIIVSTNALYRLGWTGG